MRSIALILLTLFLAIDAGHAAFSSRDSDFEETYSSAPAGFDGASGMSGGIGPSTTNAVGFGAGDATANLGIANSSATPLGTNARLDTANRPASRIYGTSGVLSSGPTQRESSTTRKAKNLLF